MRQGRAKLANHEWTQTNTNWEEEQATTRLRQGYGVPSGWHWLGHAVPRSAWQARYYSKGGIGNNGCERRSRSPSARNSFRCISPPVFTTTYAIPGSQPFDT